MKIIITESQKKLLFENSINDSLINILKTDGWESAVELVGSPKNLMKLLKIKTPMEFLNLFNDLNVVQSEEKPNLTLFRYVKGNNMVIYNKETGYAYVNYDDIWSFFEKSFDLNYDEIRELIKDWLSEVYNLREVTPRTTFLSNEVWLSEVYNLKK
jgi:hypothetical protein